MIKARVVFAPMSGVTDIPCRITARKFGCGYAFTEMIDVNGILYNSRKSFRLMDRVPGDGPLGVQLVTDDAEKLLKVALICEEKGFPVVDINAGCPARKVIKGGKGSALMRSPRKLAGMVEKLVKTLRIPVTVKIRSGWDEEHLNYLEVSRAAAGAGAAAICVHPRTREQMYKGKAPREVIRQIKEAVDIPVFASGNIFSADDVLEVFEETGCDAVFVARGALGRPWIFREIKNALAGKAPLPEPSFDEIKEIIKEHFLLCVEHHGENLAVRRMYKQMCWYMKKTKGLDAVMKAYRSVRTPDEFAAFMDGLCMDERRHLSIREK